MRVDLQQRPAHFPQAGAHRLRMRPAMSPTLVPSMGGMLLCPPGEVMATSTDWYPFSPVATSAMGMLRARPGGGM